MGRRSIKSRVGFVAVVFALTAAIALPAALAAAPGSFSPTGSMGVKRNGPAAAPLPDGRVLIAGGNDGGANYLQSAEIYDPATGSFSPAASMGAKRQNPAAAPLPDGRVLIAGGFDGANYLQSAELFALAPRAPFSFRLVGKKLLFTAPVAGTVSVSDAAAKSGASAAKKKKKKKSLSLKTTSAGGGPGTITLALKLTGKAKKLYKSKGKAKVRAKITFTPKGQCAKVMIKSCYDAGTETATLKVKKKKKRKKK